MEYFVNQIDRIENIHTRALENRRIKNTEDSIEIYGKIFKSNIYI